MVASMSWEWTEALRGVRGLVRMPEDQSSSCRGPSLSYGVGVSGLGVPSAGPVKVFIGVEGPEGVGGWLATWFQRS